MGGVLSRGYARCCRGACTLVFSTFSSKVLDFAREDLAWLGLVIRRREVEIIRDSVEAVVPAICKEQLLESERLRRRKTLQDV